MPPGVPHSEGNLGTVEITGVVELRPALHTKEFHEALAGLVADGRTTARGAPKNPLQLGATFWHFRHESRVTSPPIWVQNLVFPPLWAAAKVFGLRPYHQRWDSRTGDDPQPTVLTRLRRPDQEATMADRPLHVVFGVGNVGRTLTAHLSGLGYPVRAVSRSQPSALPEGVVWREADAGDAEAAVEAASSAAVIYQCLNAPYSKWPTLFPPLQRGRPRGGRTAWGASGQPGESLRVRSNRWRTDDRGPRAGGVDREGSHPGRHDQRAARGPGRR